MDIKEVVSMRRTEFLQETRKMRFEEAYYSWTEHRISQEEAGRLLGVCERTFLFATNNIFLFIRDIIAVFINTFRLQNILSMI